MIPAAPAPGTPVAAASPARIGSGTAPLPGVVLPPSSPAASSPLTREPARDTLAPSSFGVIGGSKPAAPAPTPMRSARAPMPTLGDLEGATATATLRPPGAVPPPPRALPMPTPHLDAAGLGSSAAIETPLPAGSDEPFTPLAASVPFSPRAARSSAEAPAAPAVTSTAVPSQAAAKPAVDAALDSTLDMAGSVSKKATQAALIEQSRLGSPAEARSSAVPAPGLFIADEPVEPRPKQPSLVTAQRELLTRMRGVVLLLGGILLMMLGALVVLIFRRGEATTVKVAAPSASVVRPLPGCRLAQVPSRISPIERSVPIATLPLGDGSLALGIADTKTSAAGWIYDAVAGEARRKLAVPLSATGDVTHVTPTDPLVVDRSSSDFAFGHTLSRGLALGVGPSGILRRGEDGATGVIWPLATGTRVTPPRVVSAKGGHFVAFRQGGAEGQLMSGWLRADGSALGELSSLGGAPKTLGTPNVALTDKEAILLFAARQNKSEPYRVHAARAALGQAPGAPRALDLPAEGGGAIAPSITAFPGDRFLVQWTHGNVGQYQVHMRILDAQLEPSSEPVLVSAKGANAGQGTIVVAGTAVVSFFIQTTAGHDELWGATLSCH